MIPPGHFFFSIFLFFELAAKQVEQVGLE